MLSNFLFPVFRIIYEIFPSFALLTHFFSRNIRGWQPD